jgi:hypothetical protein
MRELLGVRLPSQRSPKPTWDQGLQSSEGQLSEALPACNGYYRTLFATLIVWLEDLGPVVTNHSLM